MMVTLLPIGRGGAEPHRCRSFGSCAVWDEQTFATTLGRDLWYGENRAVVKGQSFIGTPIAVLIHGSGPTLGWSYTRAPVPKW
jgi:hypothetical protein